MTSRPSKLRGLSFGLWAAVVLALAACSRQPSPEAEIRELIERAATAAEARDVRDLRAMIADDYADERGLDRKAVENLLRLHVLRQQSIHLFVRVRGIEFPEPDRALASIAVAMVCRNLCALMRGIFASSHRRSSIWCTPLAVKRRPLRAPSQSSGRPASGRLAR